MNHRSNLIILLFFILFFFANSCKKDVPGCNDPLASNYNPDATENDGTCIFSGCTNPEAENYDPNANADDGSCIIKGCTNPKANNYNPEANTDDGSCEIEGCDDPEAVNYDSEVTVPDPNSCIYRKDIYLGTYLGSMDCDNPIIDDQIGGMQLQFYIREIDGQKNDVVFEVDFNIDIIENPTGIIDPNLTMYFENDQKGVEFDVDGDGTPEILNIYTEGIFNLDEETMNTLTGIFHIEIYQDFGGQEVVILESDCDVLAVRQ